MLRFRSGELFEVDTDEAGEALITSKTILKFMLTTFSRLPFTSASHFYTDSSNNTAPCSLSKALIKGYMRLRQMGIVNEEINSNTKSLVAASDLLIIYVI